MTPWSPAYRPAPSAFVAALSFSPPERVHTGARTFRVEALLQPTWQRYVAMHAGAGENHGEIAALSFQQAQEMTRLITRVCKIFLERVPRSLTVD
jgi:hypothetical protein